VIVLNSLRTASTPGIEDLEVPVDHPAHHHHRVVALLHRLPVEVPGQLREVVFVEPHRQRDVLLAGGELVPDLCAQQIDEGRAVGGHPPIVRNRSALRH
jgi:hypothetical protein